MPAIVAAYEGRVDMINAIFGGTPKNEEPMSGEDVVQAFRAMK